MCAFFVVQESDSEGRTAESRYEVADLTLTSTFVTAANALASAIVSGSPVSVGGISRMSYQHDIVTTPVSAQTNSDVRKEWAMTGQVALEKSFRMKVHAPYQTGNLVPGTRVRAKLTSTAWAAYIAAITASNFGWLSNYGTANPALVGALLTARSRVTPRAKNNATPDNHLGGHLVIEFEDSEIEHSDFRIRVTPLTVSAPWVTAATAVLAAAYGAGKISHAGVNRAFLEQDILTAPIAAGADTNVRLKWTVKSKAPADAPFKMNIPCPLNTGNLAGGDEVNADLGTAGWLAFIAALTATNLGWISNNGVSAPVVKGATSNAFARKTPRATIIA